MFRVAPPTRLALTRRRLVTGLSVSALALTACDLDPATSSGSGSGSGAGDGGAAGSPADPDLAALAQVREATATAASVVTATVAAHPDLAARLTPLGDLHAAHASTLAAAATDPADAPSPATPVVPPRPRPALAAVRASERTLADSLAALALAAESGTFARLLAVMSAAVEQELAALERDGAAS